MKTIYISILSLLFVITSQAQDKKIGQERGSGHYYIEMPNGDRVYANRVEYKTPAFGKDHFLIDSETKYSLAEVAAYRNPDGEFVKFYFNGTSNFYKKEIKGRINTFSNSFTTYTPNMGPNGMMMGGYFNRTKVEYYAKDGGGLTKLKYRNLKVDLSDNPESMAYMKKASSVRTVNALLYVVGGGMIIGGLIDTFSDVDQPGDGNPPDGPEISPLFIGGAIMVTIPLFTAKTAKRHMNKAIDIYNK